MDELRKDLRVAFERRQAGLGELRGPAEPLVRRALAARDEGLAGRWQLAAGIAAVLIAATVIATFAYVRAGIGRSNAGPTTPASSSRLATPVTNPSPIAFSPRPASEGAIVDVDVVDASTGWALLTTCIQPMTGMCHYLLTRTTNGGATWSRPVRLGPGFDPANGSAPRHVHFLNSQDGFVYGAAEAYVTHDGGRTWGSTGLKPAYFALFSGRGSRAWAISYPCAIGFICSYEVRSSVNAGRTWSKPYTTTSGFFTSDAIAFPNNGLFMTSQGDMELTLDGGTTWSFIKSRCATSNFIANVATSDGSELWELCTAYPSLSVAKMNLFVSEDGGKSWTQGKEILVSGQQATPGYLVVLVSSRPGNAVIATNLATSGITHDAGRTWANMVGPAGVGFEAIRFANGFDGWALDVSQNIWFTHDGGDSWKELPGTSIPSAS